MRTMHTSASLAASRPALASAVNATSSCELSLHCSSSRVSDVALRQTSGCAAGRGAVADGDAVWGCWASVSCSSGMIVGDSAAGMVAKAVTQASWSTRTCRLRSMLRCSRVPT